MFKNANQKIVEFFKLWWAGKEETDEITPRQANAIQKTSYLISKMLPLPRSWGPTNNRFLRLPFIIYVQSLLMNPNMRKQLFMCWILICQSIKKIPYGWIISKI